MPSANPETCLRARKKRTVFRKIADKIIEDKMRRRAEILTFYAFSGIINIQDR